VLLEPEKKLETANIMRRFQRYFFVITAIKRQICENVSFTF